MANTRHGHQIPFSPVDSTADSTKEVLVVARCGGPRLCMECREDVYQWMRANNYGRREIDNA